MTFLILLSGPPAAGKSSTASDLATELNLPLLAKDQVKEALYEGIGSAERVALDEVTWSRTLSDAAYRVMLAVAAQQRAALLDGNFDRDRVGSAILEVDPEPAEIYFWAPKEVIIERFRERRPERHPAHRDDAQDAEDRVAREAERGPLRLGEPLLKVRTDEDVDVDEIADWIRSLPRWKEIERPAES